MEDEGVAVPAAVRAWSGEGPGILAGGAAQGTKKFQGGGGWGDAQLVKDLLLSLVLDFDPQGGKRATVFSGVGRGVERDCE